MALETGTDPAEAWEGVKKTALQFKAQVPGMNATLSTGGVRVEDVQNIYRVVLNAMAALNVYAAVSGLDVYVATLPGKATYVATTEIGAVTTAMQTALTWMDTNASGLSLTGDTFANAISLGSIATNRFGAGATSQLRTDLTAIADAING